MTDFLEQAFPCPKCETLTLADRITVEGPQAIFYLRCLACGARWELNRAADAVQPNTATPAEKPGVSETIFCIVHEQRKSIYSELRSIEEILTMLHRKGLEWEPYRAELGTCVQRITRVLESLPRDPRCEQSGT